MSAEFEEQNPISKEELEDFKNIYESKGAEGYISHLKEKMDKWKLVPLKIGVIGSSGVGKSSFINAIRGLRSKDPGAARVGVTETTLMVKDYPHPNNPMVQFWDLPGSGTTTFPKRTYLADIKVDAYDCFVVLSAKRFTEDDLWLSREIAKRKKHFYFVRTHIQNDIENDKRENGADHDEKSFLQVIREKTAIELKEFERDRPVFLIDNFYPRLYDFDDLERAIINDLPTRKREAMILSMSTTTRSMIKLKVQELRKRINLFVFASGAATIPPIPGISLAFDINLLRSELQFYFCQLGIDDVSLRKWAQLASRNYDELKAVVTREFPDTAGYELFKSLAESWDYSSHLKVAKLLQWIPFVGTFLSPISMRFTQYALDALLDRAEKISMEIHKPVY